MYASLLNPLYLLRFIVELPCARPTPLLGLLTYSFKSNPVIRICTMTNHTSEFSLHPLLKRMYFDTQCIFGMFSSPYSDFGQCVSSMSAR